MTPNLGLIVPFGSIDPALMLIKGQAARRVSIEEAVEMVFECFRKGGSRTMRVIKPNPSQCAEIEVEGIKHNLQEKDIGLAKRLYTDFATRWCDWTLKMFALAANDPNLFRDIGAHANISVKEIEAPSQLNVFEVALDYLRIEMSIDLGKSKLDSNSSILLAQSGTPVAKTNGELEVQIELANGNPAVIPVRLTCSCFEPVSSGNA